MKSIQSLIPDIHRVLTGEIEVTEEQAERFALSVSQLIKSRLIQNKERAKPTLRMSQMGNPDRKLWYQINQPEKAEPLSPETLLKFLYGDMVEELVLFLAEVSGHDVTDRQRTVSISGVDGHLDAIIDGVLVDCKSASGFQFAKFKTGTIVHDDQFGYLPQLRSYLQASKDNPNLKVKGEACFLAVNKENGALCLMPVKADTKDLAPEYDKKKAMVAGTKPSRCHEDVPEGKSGNRRLGTVCSYCSFKKDCWADANHGKGLQVYSYSKGPTFLTHVAKEPNVDRF